MVGFIAASSIATVGQRHRWAICKTPPSPSPPPLGGTQVYPTTWVLLNVTLHKMVQRVVELVLPVAKSRCLEDKRGDFPADVWSALLRVVVYNLCSDSLVLEDMTEATKIRVIERYGDLRVVITETLMNIWFQSGINHMSLIPTPTTQLVMKCLTLDNAAIHRSAFEILKDAMVREFEENVSLLSIEVEVLDAYSTLSEQGPIVAREGGGWALCWAVGLDMRSMFQWTEGAWVL